MLRASQTVYLLCLLMNMLLGNVFRLIRSSCEYSNLASTSAEQQQESSGVASDIVTQSPAKPEDQPLFKSSSKVVADHGGVM